MPIGTSDGQTFESSWDQAVSSLRPADQTDMTSEHFVTATNDMGLNKQEQSLYQEHLWNLNGPHGVDNPDGSRSTLFATTVGVDDKYYRIPTVFQGHILSQEEALQVAKEKGLDNYPSYKSPEEAQTRYDAMHQYMERDTADYMFNKSAMFPTFGSDSEIRQKRYQRGVEMLSRNALGLDSLHEGDLPVGKPTYNDQPTPAAKARQGGFTLEQMKQLENEMVVNQNMQGVMNPYYPEGIVYPRSLQNISDVPLDRSNKNNPTTEFGGGRGAGGGGSGPLRSANDNSLSRSGKDLGSYEAVSRDQVFQRLGKNADIRDYDSWKAIAEKENHLVNNKPNAYAAARAASRDGKTSVMIRENGQRTLYHDGEKIVRDRLDHVKNLIDQ
jgi:hypothetical protein